MLTVLLVIGGAILAFICVCAAIEKFAPNAAAGWFGVTPEQDPEKIRQAHEELHQQFVGFQSDESEHAAASETWARYQAALEDDPRYRAQAAQRRGQDTPHTTTDRALRIAPVTSIDEARRTFGQRKSGGAA